MTASSSIRVSRMPLEAAPSFLDRFGARGLDETWVALAAYEDATKVVGLAVLGASSSDVGRFTVAVSPDRRRLGIGTVLLRALEVEACDRQLPGLRITFPSEEMGTEAFLVRTGVVRGRLTVNGMTSVVLGVGVRGRHGR